MCIICSNCFAEDASCTCPSCLKPTVSIHNSQELQGLFDNIHYMLEMSQKSTKLLHDLQGSNKEMGDLAKTLADGGPPEEEKQAEIKEIVPQMSKMKLESSGNDMKMNLSLKSSPFNIPKTNKVDEQVSFGEKCSI